MSLTTTLQFIASDATSEDIDRVIAAVNARSKVLRAERAAHAAATLVVGSEVTLARLSPKALNGLTGEIVDFSGERVDVHLDTASTEVLAYGRTRFAGSAHASLRSGTGYIVRGVPVSAVEVGA
jgi:hypothetical protein